jgi:hypothetical protein
LVAFRWALLAMVRLSVIRVYTGYITGYWAVGKCDVVIEFVQIVWIGAKSHERKRQAGMTALQGASRESS